MSLCPLLANEHWLPEVSFAFPFHNGKEALANPGCLPFFLLKTKGSFVLCALKSQASEILLSFFFFFSGILETTASEACNTVIILQTKADDIPR